MHTLDHSPSGLIEFTTEEARSVIRCRCGSDETLQSTLNSLACDDLADIADLSEAWTETQIIADVDQLELDLLLSYERVVCKTR